jgi:signal transduction histidine kinase
LRALLWTVWLTATAATVVHALDPGGLVVHSPSSPAVVETAVACAATLLAALFIGRWRQLGLLLDLGTAFALAILATGKIAFTVIPLARGGVIEDRVRVAALLCGAVAAVLLGLATLAPDGAKAPRHRYLTLVGFTLAVAGAVGLVWGVAPTFVDTFHGLVGPPTTDALGDGSLLSVMVVHLISASAFFIASLRFARRERIVGDAFFGWFAVAVALWALARVNYGWTPTDLANDLTVGDWLRMGGYAVGIVAASYEFTGYWRRLADVAVLEERRRLAREMHDGLAQDLAFIATQARSLERRAPEKGADILARAAERALDESRRAIAALTRPIDEPLDVALAQQAEELSGRLGVRVLLDLEPVKGVDGDTREALLRIAREAITNAGRHGKPTRIMVQLANHDGVTLRVSDDGRGFVATDPRVTASGRYGLAGMRERAEALGGTVNIESVPYSGTKVEVKLP